MTEGLSHPFITALALPASCRVDQRVPKKMLIDKGTATAADKRLLQDAIEEVQWLAALKPHTVGVPEYRDTEREYLEVAVLSVATRGAHATVTAPKLPEDAKQDAMAETLAPSLAKPVNAARLAELVHRAVPYPVLLLLATPQGLWLSMAHKRWAHNEAGKVVVDGEVLSLEAAGEPALLQTFMQSLALARQPQATLLALYQGWLDCLSALQAAHYTGRFKTTADPAHAAQRRTALRDCLRLDQEAARLRALAAREKQMAKQVDLNLALQRVQAEQAAARAHL
jgi:hypothetical protein